MSNFTNIQEELKQMAPSLAAIQKSNPYKIPMDYFSDSRQALKHAVGSEELSLSSLLTAQKNKTPYKVPENYFSQLPQRLTQVAVNFEEDELQLAKPENSYKVPQGYFDNLASTILAKAQEQEADFITEEVIRPMDSGSGYQVPTEYFTQVAGKIEESVVAPKVETGGRVIDMEPVTEKAKVRPMWKRALAVAAMFLMMATVGYFVTNVVDDPTSTVLAGADPDNLNPEKTLMEGLATLTSEEINTLIKMEGLEDMDEDILMEGMETEDFINLEQLDANDIREFLEDELDYESLKDLI